jgi:hypothetical protein
MGHKSDYFANVLMPCSCRVIYCQVKEEMGKEVPEVGEEDQNTCTVVQVRSR